MLETMVSATAHLEQTSEPPGPETRTVEGNLRRFAAALELNSSVSVDAKAAM
jgi:hypothetical protein